MAADPLRELRTLRDVLEYLHNRKSPCGSFSLVARGAYIQEDLARRTVDRFANALGDPLISIKDKTNQLTVTARDFLTAATNLLSIGRFNGTGEMYESVNLEVAAGIGSALVTDALKAFIGGWGGSATIKIGTLDEETIQQKLSSGEAAFGIAWMRPEEKSSGEALPEIPWKLFAHLDHRFANQDGPVTPDQFLPEDRVFVAAGPGEKAAMEFAKVAGANRFVVDSAVIPELVGAAGLGLGLTPEFSPARAAEPFMRLPVGLEPVRLGLLLPRKKGVLSEAARAFLDLIRTTIGRRSETEPAIEDEQKSAKVA